MKLLPGGNYILEGGSFKLVQNFFEESGLSQNLPGEGSKGGKIWPATPVCAIFYFTHVLR